jgi:hypothetical protein
MVALGLLIQALAGRAGAWGRRLRKRSGRAAKAAPRSRQAIVMPRDEADWLARGGVISLR